MNLLPNDFQFSQASLQDFTDCKQRFWLRYVKRLAWPAVQAEPAGEFERELMLGERFHRMAHQHRLGVPIEKLTASIQEDELHRWWQNYLTHAEALIQREGVQDCQNLPEIMVNAPLEGYRMVAKYDLLVLCPSGQALIVDWKTSRQPSRPRRRQYLDERLQTRVYPYLLMRAGEHLFGSHPAADQVEMVYWFANYPTQAERFRYTSQRFTDDENFLSALVAQISGMSEPDFEPTAEEKHCRFCVYRSYCARGVKAGEMDADIDAETDDIFAFDFDQIEEIAY
jgi:CRISPR/Cas system-associated exonuclease Cas4 (RecB family)